MGDSSTKLDHKKVFRKKSGLHYQVDKRVTKTTTYTYVDILFKIFNNYSRQKQLLLSSHDDMTLNWWQTIQQWNEIAMTLKATETQQ